uniref:(northern house mosquito) hypothetical protein n=1 Tax=Culex pipiens TaxID=7175 RepID=A0A8D8I7X9_CULPI
MSPEEAQIQPLPGGRSRPPRVRPPRLQIHHLLPISIREAPCQTSPRPTGCPVLPSDELRRRTVRHARSAEAAQERCPLDAHLRRVWKGRQTPDRARKPPKTIARSRTRADNPVHRVREQVPQRNGTAATHREGPRHALRLRVSGVWARL